MKSNNICEVKRSSLPDVATRPVVLVVEGMNDFEFLRRISARLHAECPEIISLAEAIASGHLIVIPLGGGDPSTWPDRLAPLGLREFHLYDREQEPESDQRRKAVERVNARDGCRGFLTGKRALENYLHPSAIAADGGREIIIESDTHVALTFAQISRDAFGDWDCLSFRKRRRLIAQAKRWLNTVAVEHMTALLLNEVDPEGEVLRWLNGLAALLPVTESVKSR